MKEKKQNRNSKNHQPDSKQFNLKRHMSTAVTVYISGLKLVSDNVTGILWSKTQSLSHSLRNKEDAVIE